MNEAAETLFYWIRERELIRELKEKGCPPEWTEDKVLQQYHFCNVHREDDRVTKELRKAVVSAQVPLQHLPFAYTLARLFNRASTLWVVLAEIHAGRNWLPRVKALRANGGLIFHTAYVVSTCGQSMDKLEYVDGVANAVKTADISRKSLRHAFEDLRKIDGLGSFLAGQVVADLKNDRYLEGVHDWHTWSCMGPGSKKGLEYIFDRPINEKNYQYHMEALMAALPDDIRGMKLHAQDLQNCLCEFSKYWRYINKVPGRKRIYHGTSTMGGA
jgi:hypothetical protein